MNKILDPVYENVLEIPLKPKHTKIRGGGALWAEVEDQEDLINFSL
jgi:hypothetical protein